MPRLAEVIDALELVYPSSLAAEWDAIGLVCGDREAFVDRVHFAVDPVSATVHEALASGAQLLVTHHPLFLSGVTSVATDTYKGRLIHDLITRGCALYVAHTNADAALPGVSDALADALGLVELGPLVVADGDASGTGSGRIGSLPQPMSFERFVAYVAERLPRTAAGIRGAGDPTTMVRRIAVMGGAGDSHLTDASAAGVDAYVTGDLKHHRLVEHLESDGPAVVDVTHWASEWPWLEVAARFVQTAFAAGSDSVQTSVSTLVTDPWTVHA